MAKMKSSVQIKKDFLKRGETIADWAREHGFKRGTVYRVLRGSLKARYGQSHKIAVLLGLKDGIIK